MNRQIVLYSGGLDSTCLLTEVATGYPGHTMALNVGYGSKHQAFEQSAARAVAEKLGVPLQVVSLPLDTLGFESTLLKTGGKVPEGHYADATMRSTVVPFRNGILLALAVGVAENIGAADVWIASHFGDHPVYPDCREDFSRAFAEAARLGTYAGVRLRYPYAAIPKEQVLARGLKVAAPVQLSWSCYQPSPTGKHCGKCGTCVERREAFQLAGVIDPTEYEDGNNKDV